MRNLIPFMTATDVREEPVGLRSFYDKPFLTHNLGNPARKLGVRGGGRGGGEGRMEGRPPHPVSHYLPRKCCTRMWAHAELRSPPASTSTSSQTTAPPPAALAGAALATRINRGEYFMASSAKRNRGLPFNNSPRAERAIYRWDASAITITVKTVGIKNARLTLPCGLPLGLEGVRFPSPSYPL